MAGRMATETARTLYRKRKQTVEPVFGIIKEVLGFRRFHLRGLPKVQSEWQQVCLSYNFKSLFPITRAFLPMVLILHDQPNRHLRIRTLGGAGPGDGPQRSGPGAPIRPLLVSRQLYFTGRSLALQIRCTLDEDISAEVTHRV